MTPNQPPALDDALGLVRAGRLDEAVTAIQAALGAPSPRVPMPTAPAGTSDGRGDGPGDGAGPAGQFLRLSYSGHGGSRAYRLYVPTGYTGAAGPSW